MGHHLPKVQALSGAIAQPPFKDPGVMATAPLSVGNAHVSPRATSSATDTLPVPLDFAARALRCLWACFL